MRSSRNIEPGLDISHSYMSKEAIAIESLRMPEGKLHDLLDRCERAEDSSGFAEQRQHRRYQYRHRISVTILSEDQDPTTYSAMAVNISSRGMAILMGMFVYPGSRTSILLTLSDGETLLLTASVLRCKLLEGRVHEVAVMFDSAFAPGVLEDVVVMPAGDSLDAAEPPAEQDRPDHVQTLDGSVLIVDDFKPDRKLLHHVLEKAGMRVTDSAGGQDALQALNGGAFDFVILDQLLEDSPGLELVTQMRDSGYDGPILLYTADDDEQLPATATDAGCGGFLEKPADAARVREAVDAVLSEHRKSASGPAPIRSRLADDQELRTFIEAFLESITPSCETLEQAVEFKQSAPIRAICFQMKAGAVSYGFDEIKEPSETILPLLKGSDLDWVAIREAVRELVGLLKRLVL